MDRNPLVGPSHLLRKLQGAEEPMATASRAQGFPSKANRAEPTGIERGNQPFVETNGGRKKLHLSRIIIVPRFQEIISRCFGALLAVVDRLRYHCFYEMGPGVQGNSRGCSQLAHQNHQ